jgi:hypothetical protein
MLSTRPVGGLRIRVSARPSSSSRDPVDPAAMRGGAEVSPRQPRRCACGSATREREHTLIVEIAGVSSVA